MAAHTERVEARPGSTWHSLPEGTVFILFHARLVYGVSKAAFWGRHLPIFSFYSRAITATFFSLF